MIHNCNFTEDEQEMVRQRKIVNKNRSLSGIVSSEKNNTGVWFESALERDFALILENKPNVSEYQEQPVKIEYFYKDKFRVYTPDFLVRFNDGTRNWLCEIKYRKELREKFSKLKPKFRAAIEYCKEEDWEFKIFTELDIRNPFLENIKFLSNYKYEFIDNSCFQLLIQTLQELGPTTPHEFMLTVKDAHFDIKGRCLYALWYSISSGTVGCDIVNETINMNSDIWLESV